MSVETSAEPAVIELTEEQARRLSAAEQPAAVVDPATGQVYRLIKQEVYDLVRGTLKPYGRGWDDDRDDDLIRKDA